MNLNKAHPTYVSNDSSLGGDDFYDAVEDLGKQRLSSVGGASSASYGSTSRARSSSAGTLVPTPAAAELMAALASADSSKNVDLSEFATAGEYETPGSVAMDEGEPGGSLGLDGFYRERSTNPFNSGWGAVEGSRGGDAAGGIPGGYASRSWSQPGHQQPSRMVITDISSSETTPVHTPVAGVGDVASPQQNALGEGVSSTLPWQVRSPTPSPPPLPPPRLPPRTNKDTAASTIASMRIVSAKNPFAAETVTTARGTDTPAASSNPFAKVNTGTTERSPVNPFDEASPTEANCKGEKRQAAPPANGEGLRARNLARKPPAAVASTPAKVKPTPPPLPPRRPASSHKTPDASTRKVEERSSSSSCSQSTASSAPAVDTARKADSTESSATNDSNGGTPGKKYMVINKDTGEQFDVRELEQHMPATDYTLLPSRRDLMELECRRSIEMSADTIETPRSKSASPRSSLPSTVAASMTAAVGTASSRKERAKTLGSMMRKRLGRVASVAGAAATGTGRDSVPSVEGGGDRTRSSPGGPGDRGSGGMGAAARAVSGALSGIRVSLKGKESSESLAGLMLFQELQCHQGPIWAAEFNQSGQFLATAGQDARILLHRVGDLREELGGVDGVEKSDNPDVAPSPAFASTPVAAGENIKVGDERGKRFSEEYLKGKRSSGKNGRVLTGVDDGAGGVPGGNDKGLGNAQEEAVAPCQPTSAGGTAGSGDAAARGSRTRAAGAAAVAAVIDTTPWQILEAHKKDVVALAWSRNDFLLSASLDKTVRLWHTTQGHCLHFFKHNDIVTSVDFHPLFEHFFLSGCFDKKIRVWNIRDGRVQEWQQAPDMVTAAKFSLDGNMIVAGLIKGQVLFYQTEGIRYFTQIECRNRRGMKKRGRKVSGFAFKRTGVGMACEGTNGEDSNGVGGFGGTGEARSSSALEVDHAGKPTPRSGGQGGSATQGGGRGPGGHVPEQLLVTTNDSRLRLYNTDDFGMNAKFKGFTNDTLQLTATFSEDGKRIICGSENGKVFVWSTGVFANPASSSLHGTPAPTSAAAQQQQASTPPAVAPTQKETQRCDESFQATFEPPRIVTTACFVPESTTRACVTAVRGRISKDVADAGGYCGCMILATDYNGALRVYCKPTVLIG